MILKTSSPASRKGKPVNEHMGNNSDAGTDDGRDVRDNTNHCPADCSNTGRVAGGNGVITTRVEATAGVKKLLEYGEAMHSSEEPSIDLRDDYEALWENLKAYMSDQRET